MVLERKLLWILWVGVGFFIAAFAWHAYFSGDRNLARYKTLIERDLHRQEQAVEKVMGNVDFFERQLLQDTAAQYLGSDTAYLTELHQQPFNIVLFREGQPVFWTRNDVLPLGSDLRDSSLSDKPLPIFKEYKSSSLFELRYRYLTDRNGDRYAIAALLPIKWVYSSFGGSYLNNHFEASDLIHPNTQLTEYKSAIHKIFTYEGRFLCSLKQIDDNDIIHDIGMMTLLFTGFFFLGFFGDKLAKQMLAQYESAVVGISFFVGTLVLLRGCVYMVEQSKLLPMLQVEDVVEEFKDSIFIHTIPSLVITTVFLFWFSIFFNKEFNLPDFSRHPLLMRWTLSAAYFAVAVMLNILNIGVFHDVVNHQDGVLSFESLSNLGLQNFLAIFSLGVLQIAVFLISQRVVVLTNNLNLSFAQHAGAMLLAISFGALIYHTYAFNNTCMPTLAYAAFLFIYLSIFRQLTLLHAPRILWLTQWVIGFAFIQAFFISKFSEQRTVNNLQNYSATLSDFHDLTAEGRISMLVDSIRNDGMMRTWSNYFIRPSDRKNIVERIRTHFDKDDYLSGNYRLKFFAIKRTNEAAINEDSLDISEFIRRYELGESFAKRNNPQQKMYLSPEGRVSFLASMDLPLLKNNPLQVYMEFTRSDQSSGMVFTEALTKIPYKNLRDLNKYNYALYQSDGTLIERSNKSSFDNVFPLEQAPSLKSYTAVEKSSGDLWRLTYRNSKGILVQIETHPPISSDTLIQAIFFILILSVLLFLLTACDYFFKFLPEPLQMGQAFAFDTSLRNRIMFPVYAVFFTAFSLVFFYTYRYLETLSEKYYNADFETKSNIVSTDLHEGLRMRMRDNTLAPVEERDMTERMFKLFGLYGSSLHFFDTEGVLYATTERNIFERGFLSNHIDPVALKHLSGGQTEVYNTMEKIGRFSYRSKFSSVRDTNQNLLGYLEVPYYSRDRIMRTRSIDSWSTLAPMLLMLFILCSMIIFLSTNKSITPILRVAERIKLWRLGDKQSFEPIEWQNNDEIGEVVTSFNTQAQELGDAAEKIKEGERQATWQEMAQQVAHEIRNPLTPMKLTVQHVEMLMEQNSEDAAEYALKSNRVLLEQIGNLEKIVNEFRNFAQMPQKANSEIFQLNDLVANVGFLFSQQSVEGKNADVQLYLPADKYMIYADRSLLTGALNNLVKNAIQAIPPDREGVIRISLYREDKMAIIKISDNGTGIPEDIRDKIFKPNFTTKTYGTGVGLLITKNIIQAVNGHISFDSVEGQGTDFYIELEIEEIVSAEGTADEEMTAEIIDATKV
jgi:two-component system, NtrC family, nitrogen regulation sensor histidine kinase NtrY